MKSNVEGIRASDIVHLFKDVKGFGARENWFSLIGAAMIKLGIRADIVLSVASDFGTAREMIIARIDALDHPLLLVATKDWVSVHEKSYLSGRVRLIAGGDHRGFNVSVLENAPRSDDINLWWLSVQSRFDKMCRNEHRDYKDIRMSDDTN